MIIVIQYVNTNYFKPSPSPTPSNAPEVTFSKSQEQLFLKYSPLKAPVMLSVFRVLRARLHDERSRIGQNE